MYCQGKLISSLFFFPFVWLTKLHGKTSLSNPSCDSFESHPKTSMLDANSLHKIAFPAVVSLWVVRWHVLPKIISLVHYFKKDFVYFKCLVTAEIWSCTWVSVTQSFTKLSYTDFILCYMSTFYDGFLKHSMWSSVKIYQESLFYFVIITKPAMLCQPLCDPPLIISPTCKCSSSFFPCLVIHF